MRDENQALKYLSRLVQEVASLERQQDAKLGSLIKLRRGRLGSPQRLLILSTLKRAELRVPPGRLKPFRV